jgi:predicted membrane channel-forming protein YqfA (hemolysin III family)
MTTKKVVRVEPTKQGQGGGASWRPTPEAKGKATTYRVIALLLWALAIAGEVFAIFYVLKQPTINMPMLIGAIVVIGVLAVIGSLLWKKANLLDPASKADPVRFFIQNQLGAIIALVAFLPLIVLILTNKNMDGKQKGIATAVGVVALAIAAIMGVSLNPPSVEQYTADTAQVVNLTGRDLVFWTKDGTVYHLCQVASDLQRESKDNTIYSGRVADARAAGKERLTLKVDEELKQCGLGTPVPAAPAPGK